MSYEIHAPYDAQELSAWRMGGAWRMHEGGATCTKRRW